MTTLILGEFSTSAKLLRAVRALRERGRGRRLDTHTPYPVEGTSEALDLPRSPVPAAVLIGGLSGAAVGYSLQLFCNAIDFPINVGGRPPHAFPSFIPITFELAILFGSFTALFALLALFRFPQLYHPSGEVDAFRSATTHAFWVSVELPQPDRALARAIVDELRELGAQTVSVVEGEPEPESETALSPSEEPA
jgi:hypothetical protein